MAQSGGPPSIIGKLLSALRLLRTSRAKKLSFLIMNLLCHAVTAFRYFYEFSRNNLEGEWAGQGVMLLSGSLLISCGLLWIEKRLTQILLFTCQFGIIVLSGYPSGVYIGHNGILLMCMLCNVAALVQKPYSFILSGIYLLSYTFIIFTIGSSGLESEWHTRFDNVTTIVFGIIFITILVEITRRKSTQYNSMKEQTNRLNDTVSQLVNVNLEYQDHASILKRQSIIDERNRISREIHDTMGYTTTNIMMMMQAATELAPKYNEKLQNLLYKAQKQAKEGYEEARRALYRLRNINSQFEKGIFAIHKLIATFQEITNMEVSVEYGNIPNSFDDEIDLTVYRIVQEGITNVFRHGKATNISVRFWVQDNVLSIIIHDNGIGAAKLKEGIGLIGMKERLERFQGSVTAGNVPDGFELSVHIRLNTGNSGEQ